MGNFTDTCSALRKDIKAIGERVWVLAKHDVFKAPCDLGSEQAGEMQANIKLAYRHLEDARMRVGKIIQAFDGGTSVYDK